jgi:hypothetical protein
MANDNSLRSAALRAHRAATRKVSRLKAGSGVEVSGSDYDPRQTPDFIRSATPAQLRTLVRRLDKFNSRETQFVPDAEFKPIPRKLFDRVKKAEAKKNEFVEKFYEPFKNIMIEPAGMTVDQRMAMITPLHPHMGTRTTDSPYKKSDRESTTIHGEAGAKKLVKHLNDLATMKHEKQSLKNHRQGVMKMLDIVGDIEMQVKVAQLTNKQWAALWKYTKFASMIKTPYSHYNASITGDKSLSNSESVQTDLAVAGEYVDWAGAKDEKGRNRIRGRL